MTGSTLITEELMFQLPFRQISDLAKKNRVPDWRMIQKEIEILAENNKDDVVNFLANSMLKAITEEVTLGSVSETTIEEIKNKMGYLNSKFSHLDAYFNGLSHDDQRKLLVSFVEKEISSLTKNKDRFRVLVTSKSDWNLNDGLIYSYYLLYLDTMTVCRIALKNASQYTLNSRLNVIKTLLFAYKPILLAYLLGKSFPNKVLVKRIAELRASVNPIGVYTIDPKVYDIGRVISDISPI